MYQLVFCTSRVVSHAAGEFLVHRLLSDEQLEVKYGRDASQYTAVVLEGCISLYIRLE